MPDSISDTAVVLSLLREAMLLLDAPEHVRAAAHLRYAINELSPDGDESVLHHEAWQLFKPFSQADLHYASIKATSKPADTDQTTHR